jgi:hypothetical protein
MAVHVFDIVTNSKEKIKETAKQNAKEALQNRFAPAIRIARPGEVIGDKPLLKLVKGPKETPVLDAKGFAPADTGDAHKSANAVLDAMARLAEYAEGVEGARVSVVLPPGFTSRVAYARKKS